MNRDCRTAAALKRAQETMFREAKALGITASVIHYDTGGPDGGGICLSSIGQWARGETLMGLDMVNRLAGIIPTNLLSMLVPEGFAIVQVPAEFDHDELADAFAEYLHEKNAAHHPDSPAGRDIADCERDTLNAKVVQLPLGRAA